MAPGLRVLAVGGQPVRDILDWTWLTSEDEVLVTVAEPDGGVRDIALARAAQEPWGATFAEALFDGIRTCSNRCVFCFMRQLPTGLRPSLYVRDDDFRLSFLHGNFITLTNLTDEDVERIAEQRLTPLHISLHAVDPEVRARLVCARGRDLALERFDELLDAGIDLHVQIVLVPGINDDEQLGRSLRWLAEREGVASVGVVPLGYTRYQTAFTRSYDDAASAGRVLEALEPWQEAFRAQHGITWVQAADELYLNAGVAIPPAEHYDGLPQYENGIGMVRVFLDEWDAAGERDTAREPEAARTTVVTGELFAPVLDGLVRAADLAHVRMLVVPNAFFGGNVNVAGLLTGADIAAAISADADGPDARYLVPDAVLSAEGLTLDDMTFADLAQAAGAAVRLVSSDATHLAEELFGRSNRGSE